MGSIGTMRSVGLVFILMSALWGGALAAQSCSVLMSSNRGFTACQALPKLASTLAWTINNATNTVDFAYSGSAPSASGWVGWGINPTQPAMVGTQSLIAFQSAQGAVVYEYAITGPMKGGAPCVPGNLSINFSQTSAEIVGTEMTIFATLNRKTNDSWTTNLVWNQGDSVDLTTNAVGPHEMTGESIEAVSAVNLATGGAFGSIEPPHQRLKNNHGIISAVAWGLLLPVGIMAARYLRPFSGGNSAWFYIHVTCQCAGYAMGVAAWAMGLKLHTYNEGAVPTKHRNLGISIFALATLQMLALVLRPKPDAKYRKYWNVYHHGVGYATIILIIINIFDGLDLLQPGDKWTVAYVIALCVIGAISLVLEIISWSMWVRQRSQTKADAMHGGQMKGTGNYRTGQEAV